MTTNDFEKYQLDTASTAIYPEAGEGSLMAVNYAVIGLVNESGELAGKMKKVLRDDDMQITEEKRNDMISELGDVLWYAARLADELGVSLQQVAEKNLDKLFDRKERGVLGGSGDNR